MIVMRSPDTDLPILFDDVSYAVRGLTIIDRVSLALAPGAPTLLIGPNGSGKTTLIRLAMGLGLVLITLIVLVNALAWGARRIGELRAG